MFLFVDAADQLSDGFDGIDELTKNIVFPEVDVIWQPLVRVNVDQGRSHLKSRLDRRLIGGAGRKQRHEITRDDLCEKD